MTKNTAKLTRTTTLAALATLALTGAALANPAKTSCDQAAQSNKQAQVYASTYHPIEAIKSEANAVANASRCIFGNNEPIPPSNSSSSASENSSSSSNSDTNTGTSAE